MNDGFVVEIGLVGVDVQAGILVGELGDVAVPLVAVFEVEVNVIEGGAEGAGVNCTERFSFVTDGVAKIS